MLRCLLAVLAIAAAGCVDAPVDSAAVEGNSTTLLEVPPPVTTSIPLSRPVATPVGEPDASEMGTVVAPEGAKAILVEAQWTCASPTCGFHLGLMDEGAKERGSESGEGEASFVAEVEVGTYTVFVYSTGPSAGMSGEARATVFFGEVPEGWSAFA